MKKVIAMVLMSALLFAIGSGAAEGLTPYASIATQAVGTSYYAVGTGLAKIISDNTSIAATVVPYSGPDEWMPEVDDGSVTLGVIASMDMYWAYSGTVNYEQPHDSLRLLLSGNWSNHCTMTVLADSGIEKVSDLKGKRIGYVYGGNKLTVLLVDAALRAVGLTIDDCVQVPVPDLNDALRTLQERRVDCVFSGSNTTPASVELDQALGLKVLALGDLAPEDIANGAPAEIQAILDELVPGAVPMVAPAAGTLKEPTVLTTYPIQLCGTTFLTEDDVYAIVKSIYEHYEELAEAHVWGRQWIPENFVIGNFSVPYHDGAIKFFKEAGLWTPEAESVQAALLSK